MLVNWGFCFLLVFGLGAFMKNLKEKNLNFLSFEVLFNTKLDPLALKVRFNSILIRFNPIKSLAPCTPAAEGGGGS